MNNRTNLLSKVIQFAPDISRENYSEFGTIILKMSQEKELILYTSDQNQILLPEAGDFFALLAYFKINSIKHKVCQICNGEDMSPDGILPFIVYDNEQIVCGYKAIIESVQKSISPHQNDENFEKMAKISAYQVLFHNSEENFLWKNDEVYKMLTSQFYCYSKPWPIGDVLCWSKRNNILSKLSKVEDDSKSFEMTCAKLYSELDDSPNGEKYLYGNQITELDTLVYGHLKAISRADDIFIPELWKILVENYPKLINYMNFIQSSVDKVQSR